jgi:integrase
VRFCTTYAHAPLPALPTTLIAYGTWLVERPAFEAVVGKAQPRRMTFGPADPSTVLSHFAAIAAVHRAAGHESPTDETSVVRWKRGMRRTHGKAADQKHPFLDRHYVAAITAMPATAAGARDGAILALGLVSALRRSNLAALTVHDLRRDPEGFVVRVRRSKTDQEARGDFVVIPATFTPTCPVGPRRIQHWLKTAGLLTPSGDPDHALAPGTPLFYPVDRKDRVVRRTRADGSIVPITADAIAEIVQRTAFRLGLDPSHFAAHSLRAGFLTSADAGGAALDDSMDQSGQASRGVAAQYVRHGNPWKAGRARAARSLKL